MGLKRGRGSLQDFLVYALVDPRNKEVRYIGKSSSGMIRPRAHLEPSYSQRHRGYKKNWLTSLARLNLKPEIIVMSRHTSNEEVLAAEVDYIKLYRHLGARLTNQTDGGEGTTGRKRPADEIEKQAARLRGRVRAPEVVEKIRQTKLANGTWNASPSVEVCLRISKTLLGRGGHGLRGTNVHTGEVVEFLSIRAAKQAGHSPRVIYNQLRNIPRRPRSYASRQWKWERI